MGRLLKGDMVEVVAGKDKGKKGKVLGFQDSGKKAIVEGVNLYTKHVRPSQDNPKGGKIEIERPIHHSNLMLICPKTQKKSKVGYSILQDGSKKRVAKVSEEML